MHKLEVKNEIEINASIERVWDALVNPEQTKKYMFGCVTISDWKPGSALLWQGEYEGKTMVFVKGTVLEISVPHKLVYTVIDPNNTEIADVPENYLQVHYQLDTLGQRTRLKVTQSGFETAARGKERYEETYNNGIGWQPILEQIKSICEQ